MNKKKWKATIYIGIILWMVAFIQIGITRILHSDTSISQAFARNQLEEVSTGVELKVNLGEKNINKKAWREQFGEKLEIKVSSVGIMHYLHVRADTSINMEDMYKTRERFRSFLNKNNLSDYELTTLIECRYKGRMTSEKTRMLVYRLFKQCSALTIDTRETDSYFIAYGYRLGEQDSVMINGKKVNINIAINYDEQKGISHIYIGTPLLNIDF